jgi:AAA15 family ATPase/GTPase
MLIEFTVKNYRSIKDEQVFSLAKAKGDELQQTNSFVPTAPASVPLLRAAAIYGANAAGKSNVISAMKAMKSIVSHSASDGQSGHKMPIKPFLFDEESSESPTEFEMVFINEGVRYQYGFTATKYQVIEEWLFAFPNGRPQNWFSRINNPETGQSSYKFGDSLTGPKMVWKNATRTNALFLSTAVQLNSEQLQPVFNWFDEKFQVSGVDGWSLEFTASLCDEPSDKKRILDFLQAADIDIYDIHMDKDKFDPKRVPSDLPAHIKVQMVNQLKDETFVDIKTVHKTASNKLVRLDIEDESDGTQALFAFAGPVIDTLKNGLIMVVDELHNHFHPKLVQYLVELFHNNKTNPHNAQLIFTTHETSILNQDVFRRDQVWFCEKNDEQATSLYPLTDFSPRKDRENIEQGYLSGRYGALPFVRTFELSEDI